MTAAALPMEHFAVLERHNGRGWSSRLWGMRIRVLRIRVLVAADVISSKLRNVIHVLGYQSSSPTLSG